MSTNAPNRPLVAVALCIGIGLAAVLAVAFTRSDSPAFILVVIVATPLIGIVGFAVVPRIRAHGIVVVLVSLVGGFYGFVSIVFAAFDEMAFRDTSVWIENSVNGLAIAFVVVMLALVTVGVIGIASRDSDVARARFGWWYVGLTAIATAVHHTTCVIVLFFD